MSTDYFLSCEKCREAYHIGQDGWKFFTFYSGEKRCMAGIGDFIGRHVNNEGCRLVVLSEHRIDADQQEWAFVEWPNVAIEGPEQAQLANGPARMEGSTP